MSSLTQFLDLFLWMLAGHALMDYALQSDFMAHHKDPSNTSYDKAKYGPWWWTMLAHSILNGLAVKLVTGQWLLGIGETVIHFLADYQKCKGEIDARSDQAIHVLCKVLWAVSAVAS